MSKDIPLLVDLDGSLVKTDTLYEVAALFIKAKPWLFFMPIIWLLKGKQILKKNLSEQTDLNVATLPIHTELMSYLKKEHNSGRELILCTGCDQSNAKKVLQAYPIFSDVIASNETVNLTGKNKANALITRFGERGYDYVGNEKKDLIVWKNARKALVVGPQELINEARKVTEVEQTFAAEKPRLKTYLKAIRIHQWSKNALLFVPLMVSHALGDMQAVITTLLAFLSFSICASATYILNDIFDLESDRKHRTKCNRPIAAGIVSIKSGVILMTVMMLIGLLIAFSVNLLFVGTLLIYLFITIIYSFKLKKLATVDVLILASLFTIRVIAGGVAIDVTLSFWLLSFSMFIFLSLALVKRVSELQRTLDAQPTDKPNTDTIAGRGYYTSDINVLQTLGTTSGFMAILVMAFYINSPEVIVLYTAPKILWLISPALGYWIMRVWLLTARGQMNEDPISFAITDSKSWLTGAAIGCLLLLATMV